MANGESYLTIVAESVSEYRDRGSRFIAYAFPVNAPEDVKKRINALKKEHHKAVHHCYAYRIGFAGEQYRVNDDGEPSGTAGLPILGQIDSRQLVFAAVVVVRYFGGTLLGKPGLINAYKSAASAALDSQPHVEKTVDVLYELNFDYTLLDEVMQKVKQLSCIVQEREAELFCRIKVSVPLSRASLFEHQIGQIYKVEIMKLA